MGGWNSIPRKAGSRRFHIDKSVWRIGRNGTGSGQPRAAAAATRVSSLVSRGVPRSPAAGTILRV
jgi:hypothetical protein